MVITTRRKKITGSADVAIVFRAVLDAEPEFDREKEHFWVIGLDTKHHIKYLEMVTLGILNQSLVHPREVFRLAVLQGVESILLCHNHPSGDPQPSTQDHAVTQKLTDAGKILGIPVLDHVIIGEETAYYSFQEHGDM
jgi:DNA repair protein RadC